MTGSPSRSGRDDPPGHPGTGEGASLSKKGCPGARRRCDLNDRLTERLTDTVRLPLENLEFTVAEYLLANGARIDPGTRLLLARVRDSMGEIAAASRGLASACAAREEASAPRSPTVRERARQEQDRMAGAL